MMEEATMSLKKSLGLVSLGALIGALSYGCSSTTSNSGGGGDDGGVSGDGSVKHDSGTHDGATGDDASTGDDGGMTTCAPGDVSTFMPPAYKNAKKVAGACTQQFITSFYNDCLAPNATMTTCAPWGSSGDAAHKACAACIITAESAAQYGALIEHKGTVSVNIPGCMELKDTAGGLACAKSYQASEECDDAACAANCPVTDDASFQLYQACTQQAAANGCKTYSQAAACADAEADGGAAAACFSGMTFQDLYNSVTPIFCL
jgi:hypothetical protein